MSHEGSFVPHLPITTAKAVAKSSPIAPRVLSSSIPAEIAARSCGSVQGMGKERWANGLTGETPSVDRR